MTVEKRSLPFANLRKKRQKTQRLKGKGGTMRFMSYIREERTLTFREKTLIGIEKGKKKGWTSRGANLATVKKRSIHPRHKERKRICTYREGGGGEGPERKGTLSPTIRGGGRRPFMKGGKKKEGRRY